MVFTLGKPSKDSSHPDWIPSIFSHKSIKEASQKRIARFHRLTLRNQRKKETPQDTSNATNSEEPSAMCEMLDSLESEEKKTSWVQTDMTGTDIEEMIFINSQYKKYSFHEHEKCLPSLNIEEDDEKIKFFTGLPSFTFFLGLLNHITSNWQPPNILNLNYKDQLLLTLMKLRLGLMFRDLAYRFSISSDNVSLIFRRWIGILARELKHLILWPSKEDLRRSLPDVFKKEKFFDVRCIIDCTEIFIQRPSNLTRRSQTYSHYKNHNTIKVLVGITPNGTISFLSDCYGGRISDKELTIKSGFLEKLSPGDVLLADRGFLIRDLLAVKQVKMHVPAYTKGKPQLSRAEVETSRQLSRLRIHVERVIGQLKTFKILQGPLPITMLQTRDENGCLIDNILVVCAGLLNMLDPIVS